MKVSDPGIRGRRIKTGSSFRRTAFRRAAFRGAAFRRAAFRRRALGRNASRETLDIRSFRGRRRTGHGFAQAVQHASCERYPTYQVVVYQVSDDSLPLRVFERVFKLEKRSHTYIEKSDCVAYGPAAAALGDVERHRLRSAKDLAPEPGKRSTFTGSEISSEFYG